MQYGQGSTPPYEQNRSSRKRNGSIAQSSRAVRRALLWLTVVCVVALAVYLGVDELRKQRIAQEVAPYNDIFADCITIDGISISGMTPEEALQALTDNMERKLDSWSLNVNYRGHTFVQLNYPALGITASEQQLYDYLNEAWALTHTGDLFARKKALDERAEHPYEAYTTTSDISETYLENYLNTIADLMRQMPSDAAILEFQPDNLNEPFHFQSEQYGVMLNVEEARSEILARAAEGKSGDYELTVELIRPAVTREDLQKQVKLLTVAQTSISKRSDEDRNNNIRVAFSKINGTKLNPGEEFSFNRIVGPRDYKNGFFDAKEYAYGDLVTGIGGGVCQASTTMYQAALMANLTITDRTAHSDPVDYTAKGLDATVYYSRDRKIDFKFKNSLSGPIYISAHVIQDGSNSKNLISSIRIYGPEFAEDVVYRLRSEIVETLLPDPNPVYRLDKDKKHVTYTDEVEQYKKPREGYVVKSYLQKFVGSNLVDEKLIETDTYKAKAAEYWKGIVQR